MKTYFLVIYIQLKEGLKPTKYFRDDDIALDEFLDGHDNWHQLYDKHRYCLYVSMSAVKMLDDQHNMYCMLYDKKPSDRFGIERMKKEAKNRIRSLYIHENYNGATEEDIIDIQIGYTNTCA